MLVRIISDLKQKLKNLLKGYRLRAKARWADYGPRGPVREIWYNWGMVEREDKPIKFRKSLRNANINYRNGWFFVTSQVAHNKSILGAIVGEECVLN